MRPLPLVSDVAAVGFGSMRHNCYESLRIEAYEPIIERRFSVAHDSRYLFIEERHRHYSGGWADCGVQTYGPLTLDEAADVVLVMLTELGPAGGAPAGLEAL